MVPVRGGGGPLSLGPVRALEEQVPGVYLVASPSGIT